MPLSDYYPELQGWEPVPAKEPVRELVPTIPDPNTNPNPFLRTTTPLSLQYQQDTMKQYNRAGLSSFRVSPLAPTAQAATVSAVQSTAKVVAKQVVSTSGGGTVTSVGLAMPKEFTVTNSPVTTAGTLTAAWAPETPGTILQVPPPGLGALQAIIQNSGPTTPFTISGTPSSTPATAFIQNISNGNPTSVPTGWSTVTGTSSVFTKTTTPFTASVAAIADWAGVMLIFTGTPTIVQGTNKLAASGTQAFSSNNTAGNTIVICMAGFNLTNQAGMAPTASDSKNNVYQPVVQMVSTPTAGGSDRYYIYIFIAVNIAGGANTITFNFNDPLGHTGTMNAFEMGPIPATNSFPFFSGLIAGELPPVNLSASGNGGVGGILPVAQGGTGVSTSTGSVNVVLSSSPTLSSPTLTTPAISGNATQTGKFTIYNSVSVTGPGLIYEAAAVDKTAQTANIALTTALAASSNNLIYRVSAYMIETTAATTSSTMPDARITWTDNDSGATLTLSILPGGQTGNSTSTFQQGSLVINAKTSTNISYDVGQVVPYASSGATAMQFAFRLRLEYLG